MKAFITSDIYNTGTNVDHVGFHFDADDLAKWKGAAEKCKEMGANAVYFTDYRCAFFGEDGEPVNFRVDACSVAVFGNQGGQEFIRFYGYEKHTDIEWYTDRIYLSDLSSALSEAAKEADQ